MSTHALEHQGLGVAQYAWCTSPLRRYVDLVNQMQLVAVLKGEEPAFGQNDARLFAILSAFEARYASVNEYQQTMERFWCLRWVAQQPRKRLEATGIRDDTVRLMDAPLYFRVSGCPPLAAGQRLLVDVLEWDELDLTIQARAAQLLTDPNNPDSVGSEAMADMEQTSRWRSSSCGVESGPGRRSGSATSAWCSPWARSRRDHDRGDRSGLARSRGRARIH